MTEIVKEDNVTETDEDNTQDNRPEVPADENGGPCPPHHGPHGHRPKDKDSERPEPPKDENGDPCPPPHHGPHGGPHGPRPEKTEETQQDQEAVPESIETAEV